MNKNQSFTEAGLYLTKIVTFLLVLIPAIERFGIIPSGFTVSHWYVLPGTYISAAFAGWFIGKDMDKALDSQED